MGWSKKEYGDIKKSKLFNDFYYLKENKDVRQADIDPLKHYIRYGWKEGRNPSSLFNTKFYLNQNTDVRRAQVNPLYHFIKHGFREGRKPNLEVEPYFYWCLFTSKRKGIGILLKKMQDVLTIYQSEMFDKEFYLSQTLSIQEKFTKSAFIKWRNSKNPILRSLIKLKISTVFHYVFYGVYEGRDPNPKFSTTYYLNNNADIRKEKYINPLVCYLKSKKNDNKSSVKCSNSNSFSKNLSLYNEINSLFVTPKADIIICVGPNEENIRACLSSIRKHTEDGTYSLHLVSHKKDLTNISDILTPDIHVYQHEMDIFNYSKANNMVMKYCENDVVLLNDDTEVTSGWLNKLRDASKGTALTGAHTEYRCSGNPQMWGEGPVQTTNYPINTFCAYIPRRVINVVGLFDPEFAYYGGDDVDYSCRVLQNGFPLVISDAFIIHKKNQSYRETKNALMCESDKIIIEKYDLKAPFKLTDISPKISIIMIPEFRMSHNQPTLLIKALDSIEKMGYSNYELIIIDDCSPNNKTTRILLDYLRDHKNHIFITSGNKRGSSKARKLGVDVSIGQFIFFANEDNILLPRITSLLEYMCKHPSLDVVYCDYNVLTKTGKLLPKHNIDFNPESFINSDFYIDSSTLFGRKQVFKDIEFISMYENDEVYDWVFRLLRKGYKIGHCPEVIMNYKCNSFNEYNPLNNNLSKETHKNIKERELLLDRLLRRND